MLPLSRRGFSRGWGGALPSRRKELRHRHTRHLHGRIERARKRYAELPMLYEVTVDGRPHRLELEKVEGTWQCRLDGQDVKVDAVLTRPDVLSVLLDGRSFEIKREQTTTDLHLWVG